MRVAVDERGHFRVQVEYRIGRYQEQVWAILDTGFSGTLCLPMYMLDTLRAIVGEPEGTSRMELTDGSMPQSPYYIGSVKVVPVGQETLGHIYLLGNEPIVGLKALQGLVIAMTPEPKIFSLTQSPTFEALLKTLDP